MKAIEFYTTPEGEVTMRPIGEAERQLKETDTDFIQAFLAILREFYPEAYDALMDIYSKNSNNKRYRDFIAVRRFIKCNFGLYDNMIDVDENWNFNFEFVGCPLRGECKHDKVICAPKFNSKLSDRHATITSVSDDSVSIYGAVALPVDYRGSFYAIGKDSVGAKLVYVKYRRRYRFVKLCELFRKGFCVEDDEEQLMPDSHSSENDETKDETEVENEM